MYTYLLSPQRKKGWGYYYYCPINLCNLPSIKKLNLGKPMNNTKTIKTP